MAKFPEPPAPVDPSAVSNAQSASNIATAEAQQKLNMVNQSTPYGSVEWIADSTAPGGYRQNITLSADQQQIYNSMTNAQKLALGLTTDQIGRVEQALKSNPGAPQIQLSLDWQGNPITPGQLTTSVPTTNIDGTIKDVGQQTGSFAGSGPLQTSVTANGQFKGSIDGAGPIQSTLGNAGSLTSTFFGGAQPLATGVGDLPSLNMSYQTPSGLLGLGQSQLQSGAPLQQTFGNTNVQSTVGPTDFTADRNAITDNVWQQALSRLDPMYGKRQNDLDVMLANRGIGMNSAAFGNAQDILGREKNDAYNQALYSAVQQGAQEQNTLFGQKLQQGQFANSAAGQQYAQNQGLAQFQNDATLADFNRELARMGFTNQAQAQAYGQAQQSAQFGNQAQQQAYEQAMGKAGLQNAAVAQDYSQSMGRAQFQNAAQQQAWDQMYGAGQFANTAQAQQFGQNQAQAELYNQGILQDTDRQIQVGQFQNQAAAQQFQQNQQQAQFQNDAQAQAFQQEQARTAMAQQAAVAQFQQNYQLALLNNMTQDQAFQQAMAMDQSGFAQALAAGQFGNQAQTQNFQNQLAAGNLPINQLTALLGLGQVQAPQGLGYTPSQVGQTDVLGAYALSAKQQQDAYNAKMQQSNGIMSGLFGLGSAAIKAGVLSDERLKYDVVKLRTRSDGLGVYAFKYIGDPDQVVRVGVMAQEVVWVKPEAVMQTPSGYFAVDYSQLELDAA